MKEYSDVSPFAKYLSLACFHSIGRWPSLPNNGSSGTGADNVSSLTNGRSSSTEPSGDFQCGAPYIIDDEPKYD
jgi:hypothetical protein